MEKTFALNVNGTLYCMQALLPHMLAGVSMTLGVARSSHELIKQFLNDVPMQRFGEPAEIGELVLFICSDACEFMTADTVYVNGGGGWR
jgi:NAD(P)-dependent dehydrogenase (short-subunit alcohol dehydrogenase family)